MTGLPVFACHPGSPDDVRLTLADAWLAVQPAGSKLAPTNLTAIAPTLASATPILPSLHTTNRWAFDVLAGQSWVRIAQNWHAGWRWKTVGQDWKPFRNGPDAACWIDHLPPGTHQIQVQFFPRPPWLTFASLGALLAWLGLLPVFRRLRCSSNL